MPVVNKTLLKYSHTHSFRYCVWLLSWSCCSVGKSCLTLSNSMDYSIPGFLVLHHFLEFTQIHVLWVMMQSNHLILCHPLLLLSSSFPASGSFPMSWLFASGHQSIGTSALALVLPVNIQDWFPLGLTSLISLLSKGLSRVFSSTTIWKHQFFGTQHTLWFNSHIPKWLLETL